MTKAPISAAWLRHGLAGERRLHAERDEEQGHEEVPDAGDLRDDVRPVGKRRDAHASDQGAHLARQAEVLGDAADDEAPGGGRDQDQLRPARGCLEQPGEHVAAHEEREGDQHGAPHDRPRDGEDVGVRQVGLHGHEQDGPEILDHEDAQGQPPREHLQLELVPQELDHDEGRAERDDDGEIVDIEGARAGLVAEPAEEGEAQEGIDHELADAEREQRSPHAPELTEIDLQPDDEEQEDESDLGDELAALGARDQAQAHARTEDDAARDVAQDERLADQAGDVRRDGGEHDAERDVAEQGRVVNHARLRSPRRSSPMRAKNAAIAPCTSARWLRFGKCGPSATT